MPTNRLAEETSPYLLQHADNPVDWFPWGDEALARAAAEDKPLLVSIGYAACHWCHVMERESFEDPETAGLMNELFVNIKVDREERPDLDSVYMASVQALTGHGGWPMTVFCTPDGRPFYGGTYYPPEPRHGMPAFRQVLHAVADAWRTKRDDIEQQGEQLVSWIARGSAAEASTDPLGEEILSGAVRALLATHDREWGGFGGAPKFPQPMTLEFLLRMHLRGAPGALEALTRTLDRMARGGIFDHVGGGFHRYSTDAMWLVPHFEKMLYDNAQLLRLYARAWQVTGSDLYRETAIATGEYLLREMRGPDGGFFSSQDADAQGVEGSFTVWPYEEFIAVAGDDMPLAVAAFAVAGSGNWEGVNVLWRPHPDEEVAARAGVSVEELRAAVARVRERLFAVREQRPRPATDDKVLAGWNGLAIAALAEAGRVLGRGDFIDGATRAAEFVLDALRGPGGRLQRAWRAGRVSGPAFLEDHAMLADACQALYETTFEQRWWTATRELCTAIVTLFADEQRGGFHDTGADVPSPVVRPKDLFDNATPSGNAAAADVLLRVAALTGDHDLARLAAGFLRIVVRGMRESPSGFGQALCALDRYVSGQTEVAIIGDPQGPAAEAMLGVVRSAYRPNLVVAAGEAGSSEPALLRDRPARDAATAYVCEDFVCMAPVIEPRALAERL